MATRVVSLFLPYTIDFHDLPTPARRRSPAPNINQVSTERRSSLFPSSEPARTQNTQGDKSDTASAFPQAQVDGPTHIFKPGNPRSLVQSDSQVPEWGQNKLLNQPKLRTATLPPETILKYVQAERDGRGAEGKRDGAVKQHQQQQQRPPPRQHARKSSSRFGHRPVRSRTQSNDPRNDNHDWTVEPAVQGNGGLYNAVRAATESGAVRDVEWVGTVGFPTDSLDDNTKHDISTRLKDDFGSQAVYVSDSDLDGHYAHYCKTILWPVFHYQIPDHPKSKAYEDHSYGYYVNLNKAFANAIVTRHKEGDKIWVNDYHLLLVPGMVRKELAKAQIGFFLHTAFPSSEVFRCLATRKELLYGMLGADMVAFQSAEYSYHFLSTCKRVLSDVEVTNEGVRYDGRFVAVAAIPIGVDPRGIDQARAAPEVREWIGVLRKRYGDKKLIVARDQLDNIRGVRQKLLAFELFLNKYPRWRDGVVLIQVATSTAENTELATSISDIQTRIDADHSTLAHQPLVILRQDIAFSQYLALLSVADALLITSLRDGMNLTTHEFVLCQDGKYTSFPSPSSSSAAAAEHEVGGDTNSGGGGGGSGEVDGKAAGQGQSQGQTKEKKHGPVILSEFTGSAGLLGPQVLSINPWDYQRVADAIAIALDMSATEKERRHRRLRDIVLHQNGEAWAHSLFKRLGGGGGVGGAGNGHCDGNGSNGNGGNGNGDDGNGNGGSDGGGGDAAGNDAPADAAAPIAVEP